MAYHKILSDALKSVVDLSEDSAVVLRDYTVARTAHLLTITGEVGYDEAVTIEVDNVTAKAAELAVRGADAIDEHVRGFIAGVLRIGVVALA